MNPVSEVQQSKPILWIGRGLWVLTVPFMVMDIGMHLARPEFAVEATKKLGFNPDLLLPIGILEVIFMGLYLYKKTAVWGMIFFTAFFGGAVALHLMSGTSPVFAIVFAVLMWASLLCRDQETARKLGFGRLVGSETK